MNSKCIDYTTLTIIIIGAINWGLSAFLTLILSLFYLDRQHGYHV